MTLPELVSFAEAPFEIIDGDRGKNYPQRSEFTETGHCLFLSATNVTKSGFEFSECQFIDPKKDAALNKGKLQREDIVLTTRGTIGNTAYYKKSVPFNHLRINSGMVILRCDQSKLLPAYLYHFVRSPDFISQVNGLRSGVAQPQLPIRDMRRIKLALPDLPTQRKIAGILSAYDDLIENNLRRIKILEQMAQSLYREWFVHFRFPGHESATFKDSDLGRIPEGWEVKSIGDFGNVLTGKTPSKANEDFYGEDVPFLKTPDMHGQMFILGTNENLSILGAQSQAKKTLPIGSICVSCIGTIGVVSITTEPCQTNQQINSVALHDETSREFLFFWLREAKQLLENLGSNGATMGNVNKSKFEGMKLVRPSSEDLAKYHKYAESMFFHIEQLLRKIQTLRRTRDLLLNYLLD
jgi:type I restriction enzyme S subunit